MTVLLTDVLLDFIFQYIFFIDAIDLDEVADKYELKAALKELIANDCDAIR